MQCSWTDQYQTNYFKSFFFCFVFLTEDCDLEEFADTGVAGNVGQLIEFYVRTKDECLAACVNKVSYYQINI